MEGNPAVTATQRAWLPKVLEFRTQHGLMGYSEPLRRAPHSFPSLRCLRIFVETEYEVPDCRVLKFEGASTLKQLWNRSLRRATARGFRVNSRNTGPRATALLYSPALGEVMNPRDFLEVAAGWSIGSTQGGVPHRPVSRGYYATFRVARTLLAGTGVRRAGRPAGNSSWTLQLQKSEARGRWIGIRARLRRCGACGTRPITIWTILLNKNGRSFAFRMSWTSSDSSTTLPGTRCAGSRRAGHPRLRARRPPRRYLSLLLNSSRAAVYSFHSTPPHTPGKDEGRRIGRLSRHPLSPTIGHGNRP